MKDKAGVSARQAASTKDSTATPQLPSTSPCFCTLVLAGAGGCFGVPVAANGWAALPPAAPPPFCCAGCPYWSSG